MDNTKYDLGSTAACKFMRHLPSDMQDDFYRGTQNSWLIKEVSK